MLERRTLKVGNIDNQRMMLRIERGKGDVDREVPLNKKLLETLREYRRWMRPKNYERQTINLAFKAIRHCARQ